MIEQMTQALQYIIQQTAENKNNLFYIFTLIWGSFILTHTIARPLLYLGVIPRRLIGLPGIILSPLLHADFNHLFYNTIPLLVLSDFLLVYGLPYFLDVTAFITLISGGLLWCFGHKGIHIGASGLITGYWALLVSNIYQQGSLLTLLLGFTTLYAFAGIFLGIFPRERGVSWEGHLFGLLAGIIVSYLT